MVLGPENKKFRYHKVAISSSVAKIGYLYSTQGLICEEHFFQGPICKAHNLIISPPLLQPDAKHIWELALLA
jgi:hypothetical protein